MGTLAEEVELRGACNCGAERVGLCGRLAGDSYVYLPAEEGARPLFPL